jgi:hypothetical protein
MKEALADQGHTKAAEQHPTSLSESHFAFACRPAAPDDWASYGKWQDLVRGRCNLPAHGPSRLLPFSADALAIIVCLPVMCPMGC